MTEPSDAADPGTAKEVIVKPDGRYLIYYAFADTDTEAETATRTDGGDPPAGRS